MKKNKYKIVIFSDLKDTLDNTLKSTVSLAKMIKGDIAIFHVKKASEVVRKENQLSAIRSINSEYIKMGRKIKNMVNTFSKISGMPLSYSFAIGNLKNEIDTYLKEQRPDIIVMTKKKPKLFDLVGDKVIQYVLDQHNGPIFIADNKKVLELNDELSLGVLNSKEQTANVQFADDLLLFSKKPLKSFKIVDNSNEHSKASYSNNQNTIEFVFEKRDNSIENLSNYLTRNNISLLCVDRTDSKRDESHSNLSFTSNIYGIIGNLNVPLLLTGRATHNLH